MICVGVGFGSMGGGDAMWWLLWRGLGFGFVVTFWVDLGSAIVGGGGCVVNDGGG